MPPRLEIEYSDERELAQVSGRSERVNFLDLHPTEPWILGSSFWGTMSIWNYKSQTLEKSFEVAEVPVRSAKFIARKQWVVAGADDKFIRVFNCNTLDMIKVFEAHGDRISCVAVHPTHPYVLSSSDDMLIKLWDWEKGWMCAHTFRGHSHNVMHLTFNPNDINTFTSASLDGTVKIWSFGSSDPTFTLDAHPKGVNCVEYFTCDKPYLITGSDDHTAKVWDYQTKSCVQTLEGHTHNVSAIGFHPELLIIITGSDDGTVRIWHSTTYRLESTLNYGLEKIWAIGCMKGSYGIAISYDDGIIMVKIGREDPVAGMDSTLNYGLEKVWAIGCMKGSYGIAFSNDDGITMVKIGREEPVASMDSNGNIIMAEHNKVKPVIVKKIMRLFFQAEVIDRCLNQNCEDPPDRDIDVAKDIISKVGLRGKRKQLQLLSFSMLTHEISDLWRKHQNIWTAFVVLATKGDFLVPIFVRGPLGKCLSFIANSEEKLMVVAATAIFCQFQTQPCKMSNPVVTFWRYKGRKAYYPLAVYKDLKVAWETENEILKQNNYPLLDEWVDCPFLGLMEAIRGLLTDVEEFESIRRSSKNVFMFTVDASILPLRQGLPPENALPLFW